MKAVPAIISICALASFAIAEDKVGTRFDAAVSLLSDPIDSGTLTLVARSRSSPRRCRRCGR